MVAKSDVVCDHRRRRRMWVACALPIPGTWVPGVHANCPCNEAVALLTRSLGPVPWEDDRPLGSQFVKSVGRICGLAKAFSQPKWSYLETAKTYDGALRRRYLDAERSLRVDGPVRGSDSYLRAFLKAEKLGVGKWSKPRMIFPRDPRYNLALASYLKPLEHWLWGRLTAKRLFKGSNTRVVGKGLSPRQRANLIVRKFKQFEDCVVFEVDGKAFEAHVSSRQLQQEHRIYRAAYPRSPGLVRLLSRQMELKGVTAGGWKFSRPGGRASGDYNTGMGNTLIMLCAVVSALHDVATFDVLADGDNALIFLPGKIADGIIETFSQRVLDQCGHEMTLEKPTRCLEAIRFGQSAPIYLGHGLGWTMCRDYLKVLSGWSASHRWLSEPKGGRRWLAGVARCELSLSRGIPVLQAIALKAHLATESEKLLRLDAYRDYFVVGAWLASSKAVIQPTLEGRLSFERAFGVTPDVQKQLEAVDVVLGHPSGVVEFPTVLDIWEAEPGLLEPWLDAHY